MSIRSLLTRAVVTGAILSIRCAAGADPMANFSQKDALLSWMRGLVIELPANMSAELPMGMGPFTLIGGYCTGMTVDSVNSSDNSSGVLLEFGLQFSGIGVSCFLRGEHGGSIDINVTLAGSNLGAFVQIHPHVSQTTPDLPLPLGGINITECSADIRVSQISVTGDSMIATLMTGIGDGLASLIGGFVNEPMCDRLRGALDQKGPALLQLGLDRLQPLLLRPAPSLQPASAAPLLDWGSFTPVIVIQQLAAERFPLWFQQMVRILSVASFDSDLFRNSNMSIELNRLLVEDSDSSAEQDLNLVANSSVSGFLSDLGDTVMISSLGFRVTLPHQPELSEEINVSVGLKSISVLLRAMFNEARWQDVSLQQLMESPGCLVQCTEGVTDPQNASLGVKALRVVLSRGLRIGVTGTLEADLARLVNMVIGSLDRGYLSTENALVNGALVLAREPLDRFLWSKLDTLPPCDSEDAFLGDLGEACVTALLILSICIWAIGVVAAIIAHSRIKLRDVREHANENHQNAPVRSGNSARSPGQLPNQEVCLGGHAIIPPALATFFPFAVVAVMFLFAYSDVALGASVYINMEAQGQATTIGPFMSFSMLSTVIRCWSSGAFFLSVLTVLLCGVWPCIKLCCLLAAWLLPPSIFSVRARGQCLHFLDTWGKYSFFDSWLLVLTMRVFSLTWESKGTDAAIKLETYPTTAFYLFFLATTLSLVLGHIASECHMYCLRCEAELAVRDQAIDDSETSSRANSLDSSQMDKAVTGVAPLGAFTGSTVRIGITSLLLVSMVGSVAATVVPDFNFRFEGVLPEFLFGSSLARHDFSVASIATSLISMRSHEVGLVVLAFMFLTLAFAVPFALVCLLLFVWLVPLRQQSQEAIVHLCGFLDAWASLDVAVLVLALACLEFGKMTKYLVNEGMLAVPCALLRDFANSECLVMDFDELPGISVFVAAGALLLVVPKVTIRNCRVAIAQRQGQKYLKNLPKAGDQMA